MKAGADVNALDEDADNVWSLAIARSYDFGKEMLKYHPAGSKPSNVLISESDPIGALTLHRELGKEIDTSWFAAFVDSAPEWAWALLRSGALVFDESPNDVFNGLARCKQVKLWI